jgi:hypothetical protein
MGAKSVLKIKRGLECCQQFLRKLIVSMAGAMLLYELYFSVGSTITVVHQPLFQSHFAFPASDRLNIHKLIRRQKYSAAQIGDYYFQGCSPFVMGLHQHSIFPVFQQLLSTFESHFDLLG